MSLFDVAIFPYSSPYGSPQKLFESLAMEIPTIGPDVPAVREVFQNKKHLLTVDQDGRDFRKAVCTLKNDPNLRNRIVQEGKRYVLSNYTWDNNAKRVLSFIRDVME